MKIEDVIITDRLFKNQDGKVVRAVIFNKRKFYDENMAAIKAQGIDSSNCVELSYIEENSTLFTEIK